MTDTQRSEVERLLAVGIAIENGHTFAAIKAGRHQPGPNTMRMAREMLAGTSPRAPIEYERLVRACLAIFPDMPTGWEPAGQSMDTTLYHSRIREWRSATMKAAKALQIDGPGAPDA